MRIRTRRVPAGYRELEYIEFTGTQQVNTYLGLNMDTGIIEIDFQATTLSQNGIIIGNSGSRYFWIYFYNGTGKINCYLDGEDGGQQNLQGPVKDLKKHRAVFKNKTYYVDGVAYGTATGTLSTTTSPSLFLGSYSGNYYFQGRIFGCKIWSNEQNLVRNFIPAERISDGVIGFYNSTTDDFYPNSGSGNFIKGPYKDSYYIPVVIAEGTTNYMPFEENFSSWGSWGFGQKGTKAAKSGSTPNQTNRYCVVGSISSTNTRVEMTRSSSSAPKLSQGQKATASVYVRGVGTTIGKTGFLHVYSSNGSQSESDTVKNFTFTSDWQRVVGQFTWDHSESSGAYYNMYVVCNSMNSSETFEFCEAQFEIKDHATPYTRSTRADNYVSKIGSPKINLLPLAYQGVEYIESSGTQYIDTGISIGDKYEFVLDQLNNFDTGNHYMCGSSTAGKMLGTLSNVLWSNGLIYTNVNFNRNVREKIGLKVSITNSSGADYVATNYTTNKNMSGHSSYTPSGTSTVLLFRVGSIYETFKCYNFKLYKDEQLMRNMIPCYRKSDNVIGLYDTVTRTFYTNSGTGTFAKGADKDYII